MHMRWVTLSSLVWLLRASAVLLFFYVLRLILRVGGIIYSGLSKPMSSNSGKVLTLTHSPTQQTMAASKSNGKAVSL